jgi:hypothetical protein
MALPAEAVLDGRIEESSQARFGPDHAFSGGRILMLGIRGA